MADPMDNIDPNTGLPKVQAPGFIHDCVPECPAMQRFGGPAPTFKPLFPGQAQFPGQTPPAASGGPMYGSIMLPVSKGPNGEQILHHPHFPSLKADVCKDCRMIIPIRPPKFSKRMNKQQISEFKECFQMFDKDGDGTIDTKELGAVMRSLGQFPDMEEIEEMVDDADEDGSGSINFPEFVQLMLKRQEGGMTREEIKQVNFNIYHIYSLMEIFSLGIPSF